MCSECLCRKCKLREKTKRNLCDECEEYRLLDRQRKAEKRERHSVAITESLSRPDVEDDPQWIVETLSSDKHNSVVPSSSLKEGRRRFKHMNPERSESILLKASEQGISDDSEDFEDERVEDGGDQDSRQPPDQSLGTIVPSGDDADAGSSTGAYPPRRTAISLEDLLNR